MYGPSTPSPFPHSIFCYLNPLPVPDIVETLLPLLSTTTRTRRHVITQLVNMGLVDSAKDLKKERSGFSLLFTVNFFFSFLHSTTEMALWLFILLFLLY